MFADIAEEATLVAPATGATSAGPLETVTEDPRPTGRGHGKSGSVSSQATGPANKREFPVKTDKPRPHICLTCSRSFARLEHLKRHERSHTKEKPFECPECTRCFARRDLLLRHQQKLHMTTIPASRPRNGRRESASSTASASGKIRKNSAVHASMEAMRPRANTISHVGNPAMDMFANGHMTVDDGRGLRPMVLFGHVLDGRPDNPHLPLVPGHHGAPTGLPKLDTSIANMDMSGALRTAPVFNHGYNMDALFSPGTTIDPAALHFADAPPTAGLESPSPFQDMAGMSVDHMGMQMGGNMEWVDGFGHDLTMMHTNDSTAIAESSPSAIDTDSPGGMNDYLSDRKPTLPQHTANWQGQLFLKGPGGIPDYMFDMGLHDSYQQAPPSPSAVPDFSSDGHFASPPFQLQNPFATPMTSLPGMIGQTYPSSMNNNADSPSTLASTTDTSMRQASVSSAYSITIPEQTRHAMMITLAQPAAMFGQRQYSQPTISSPLSPSFAAQAQAAVNMPSTTELQKYIGGYITYFHPHIPIFHIPTLSFDFPLASSYQQNGRSNSPVFDVANSGGCLILAMSAIGALYEGDSEISMTLFNFSKRMLTIYLEERRKADISSVFNSMKDSGPQPNTPVWLVQAMLLNVMYGHMCGDKTAEINAHTHGAALVSLARSANLTVPASKSASGGGGQMHDERWNPRGEDPAWYEWRIAEEKKRSLFAVFHVSSVLTFAYNHTPALKNGEILLDLPCDEDLWAAESAEAWYAQGGSLAAEQRSVPFNLALSHLLSARERQQFPVCQVSQAFCTPGGQQHGPEWPRAEFHASTFGCLVLIVALHNYIWETRQRHVGRQWTSQETQNMHRQIEPALIAWQAVWAQIPHHSVERPNPFGMGPLAADSIPFLDLAYLTLYVNLGRSKECFWQRDFEGMAHEIASGYELIQHAEQDGERNSEDLQNHEQQHQHGQASKAPLRERHLRKAALHAANSMLLAARTGTTFADFSGRELPIQAAVCEFECAQVLAEWIATLQERVGPYLGILGVDPIDLESVPAIVLLDQEDITLLAQVQEILRTAEQKMAMDASGRYNQVGGETMEGMNEGQAAYSARILQVRARMLDSASVWPVMRLMCQGLSVQARFMKERAERSRIGLSE